jgi:diguanylate cyclase (GGDEF)-like protein
MSVALAKSESTARRKKRFLSIRARLIVLALLAIAPLMVQRVRGLETARADLTARANVDVVNLARHAAESQREIIYAVRALLQVVARVYAETPVNPADCSRYLSDLTGNIPWFRAVSATGPNGQIKCSTEPLAVGINVADRPHYLNALNSRDFALSDYMINRTHQMASLIASYPAIKDDDSVGGVVLASINLQWLSDLFATAAQRPGTAVLLFDTGGTLIAASADEESLVGKRFADHLLLKTMFADDEGTTATAGIDGVRRVFAYIRVPGTNARLAVGLDENVVHSGIDREIGIAYWQLILIGIFILIVVWFGGEQLIVKPIRALVRTATRFGRGDLRARAAQEAWIAEFEPLALALDDMAVKLAEREEELRIANEHLDELASLDGLTGLANRRGFDRELEREWKRAGENSSPLALMMIDIDHFKLYNDHYGHVAGDACLRTVGETLSTITLDSAVLVARYGGEEFALLLPGLDIKRTTALAEEARKAIEALLIAHAESPCGRVTVSIGVECLMPEGNQPAAHLVEAADSALYAAKRRGRNRVVAQAVNLVSKRDTHPPLVA